jgi:hypothetical protein
MPAVPADAYRLSYPPLGTPRPQFVDLTDDFVSWDTWILNAGPLAFLCKRVAMAHPARLNPDAYLSKTWHGISRSTIWKSAPGLGICTAFIGETPVNRSPMS